MAATHINFSLRNRPVIATTDDQHLECGVRIQRVGIPWDLLACGVSGDHGHIVALCPFEDAGRLAQAIETSLTQTLGFKPGFSRYYAKPVTDQLHLETLVRYVLRQQEHHGVHKDPDFFGCNGPELIGGRMLRLRRGGLVVPPARDLFRRHLRIDDAELETIMLGGKKRRPLSKLGAAPGGLAGVELERVLVRAAAAAIGRAKLEGRVAGLADARAAVLRLVEANPLGESVRPARMLGVSERAVRKLRRKEVRVDVGRAVRWQLEFQLTRRELAVQDSRTF